MAEHKPGSMDITAQEAAYKGTIKLMTRAGIFSVVVLIILALVNS